MDHSSGHVRPIVVPDLGWTTLDRVDYSDAFWVACRGAEVRRVEKWARMILEDAPSDLQRTVTRGWDALGLRRAATGAEGTVLGWSIRRNTRDVLLLGAASPGGLSGELCFSRGRNELTYSTRVQLDGPEAIATWEPLIPVHVRLVRRVLEAFASRDRFTTS